MRLCLDSKGRGLNDRALFLATTVVGPGYLTGAAMASDVSPAGFGDSKTA